MENKFLLFGYAVRRLKTPDRADVTSGDDVANVERASTLAQV